MTLNTFLVLGVPNIIGFVLGAIFILVFYPRVKNKSYKERLKPLIIVYVTLIVAEVVKIIGRVLMEEVLVLGIWPLIFCSFLLYTLPIIVHCDPERMITRIAKGLTMIVGFVIGFSYIFSYPTYTNDPTFFSYFFNYHSRIYHLIMLTSAVYLILIRAYDFRFKDFIPLAIVCGLYFHFSGIVSIALNDSLSFFGPKSQYLSWYYDIFGVGVGNIILSMIGFGAGAGIYAVINVSLRQYRRHKNPKVDSA